MMAIEVGPEATRDLVERLRAHLRERDALDEVTTLETHISHLLFAGETVYKIKKPVDLGFLDFSRQERRRHFCEEEVRLNRRLAADVYRGVVGIVDDPAKGIRIAEPDAPGVVEFAVEMSRLPARNMMDALAGRGELDNERLNGLAGSLARFHRAAETGGSINAFGTPAAVRKNMMDNFDEVAPWISDERTRTPSLVLAGTKLIAALRASTVAELDRLRTLMDRRVEEGRIRDGHGDLHSGNICFLDDGIAAYDCIEFSDAFRCGDVACDLAFLAMDLDHRGFRAMSAYLVEAYAREAGDPDVRSLMRAYKRYRAMVRAKVGIMRADQLHRENELTAAAGERDRAASYLQLACTYAIRPTLIVMSGLPASGKSYTAERLARPFEAALIQSDVERKRLHGHAPTERVPPEKVDEVYGREASRRTYEVLAEKARTWLRKGRGVVVDAVFAHPEERRSFAAIARAEGVPFLLVEVHCPEDVVLERLERRAKSVDSISDADVRVYRLMRDLYRPIGPDESPHLVLDGRMPADEQIEIVLTELMEHAPRID